MSAEVERAVLATVLVHPARFADAARRLVGEDFASIGHRALWEALVELHASGEPDLPAVHDALGARPAAADALGAVLAADLPSLGMLDRHVARVLEHAAGRRLTDMIAVAAADLASGAAPGVVLEQLRVGIDRVELPAGALPRGYLTPTELVRLAATKATPWLVPGLLRRRTRVVVVAPEGAGKSVVLRQLAVAASAGLHPFTRQHTSPARVLIVDLENDHRDAIHLDTGAVDPTSVPGMFAAAMVARPGWPFDDWLRVWSRPDGIDLRDRPDRQRLVAAIEAQRPELVTIGPVYRMARRQGRETDEDMTSAVAAELDALRERYGFALLVEAHAPHAAPGMARDLRPIGSSVWLRWPDLGRTLRPMKGSDNLTVGRFRGDRYRAAWPDELHRAGPADPWPWTGLYRGGMP